MFMDSGGVDKITVDGTILAILVRHRFRKPGCSFFTPNDFPFQLGIHIREADELVQAHQHVSFAELKNLPAQEFFYIESGKIEIGIYNGKKLYTTLMLEKGDMIVLNCAHHLKFLSKTKMIELKQGPYRGREVEKEYF